MSIVDLLLPAYQRDTTATSTAATEDKYIVEINGICGGRTEVAPRGAIIADYIPAIAVFANGPTFIAGWAMHAIQGFAVLPTLQVSRTSNPVTAVPVDQHKATTSYITDRPAFAAAGTGNRIEISPHIIIGCSLCLRCPVSTIEVNEIVLVAAQVAYCPTVVGSGAVNAVQSCGADKYSAPGSCRLVYRTRATR